MRVMVSAFMGKRFNYMNIIIYS